MAFATLDKNFGMIEFLIPLNVQWRRKYYTFGDFEIQILASAYNSNMKYVYNTQTNEVAFINKYEYTVLETGNYVMLSGYFIESITDMTGHKTESFNGIKTSDYIYNKLIAPTTVFYPYIKIDKSVSISGNVYAHDIGDNGITALDVLKDSERSFKLEFDNDKKEFTFKIWQGVDRSLGDEKSCIFSESLGNIKNIKFSEDDSNYKNYSTAYGLYSDETGGFIKTSVDWRKNGESMRELVFETNIERKSNSEDIENVQQQAVLELLNHTKISNMSFDTIGEYYEYMKDYDLGDKVKIILETLQLTYSYRIIEIEEIWKNGKRELKLVLGDAKKMTYQKGRF